MPNSRKEWPRRLAEALRSLFKDANRTCFELFKLMIPVIVVIKVLKEFDLIQYLAVPLAPIMELVGLPAKMGLVWATALCLNIYSGIVVYAAVMPDIPALSVAQVTVLSLMLLIAHNLPLELRIAQRCGVSLLGQAALRILGALTAGLLLHWIFDGFDLFAEPSTMLFAPSQSEGGYLRWALGELRTIAVIYLIVLVLMGVMRVLQHLRITDLLNWLLRPWLRFMGIGDSAASITVVGLTLGIAYGGGLIIHEARSGNISRHDLFASLSLMGLSHALIEDTLLMSLLGAHSFGTLWFRLAFSLLVVAVLARWHVRRFRERVPATP